MLCGIKIINVIVAAVAVVETWNTYASKVLFKIGFRQTNQSSLSSLST